MQTIRGIGLVMLALFVGFMWAMIKTDKPSPLAKKDVYARVMNSQTIRCGYGAWPPFIYKDPISGTLSGIFYDYTEALGHALNLKITWSEELGTGEFIPALKSGRIDAMCASVWPNAARAREIDFVRPIYYSPIYIYGRLNDHRFDKGLQQINTPNVTIVSMDGEMGGIIATSDFPKARRIDLPQGSNVSEFFVAIAMGKADVTITSPAMFDVYNASNPGKIKRIGDDPVRVFGSTIGIDSGQDQFRQMLNTATDELIANGTIDKILQKYGQATQGFLKPSAPFVGP